MPLFPKPDGFDENTCRHCAALFIVKGAVGFRPSSHYRNGTITFVECDDITYGVTCRHVVEILRKNIGKTADQSWVFATFVNRTIYIIDRFESPKETSFVPVREVDISIRQIHPDFPDAIGKKAFKLSANYEIPFDKISHGIAVGFPEAEQFEKEIGDIPGYQVAMPCVYALAEKIPGGDSFSLFSELEETPKVKSFSGMSGGPIFWTTEDDKYGLYGISYEASDPVRSDDPNESIDTGPRIWIKGEKIAYYRFKSWVESLGINKPLFEKGKRLKPIIRIELWSR